jgi:RNA polymerase sigma-70 factor (ECF subfamily)
VSDEERLAFEDLYRAHVHAVFAYARSRISRHEAVEVVEETFVIAWRRFAALPAEPRAWLIGVARNVIAHDFRAHGRRAALGARLPERDRELLALLAWADLSLDEVAEVLGCSRPTLRVRLHRARHRFESALLAAESAEQVAAAGHGGRPAAVTAITKEAN